MFSLSCVVWMDSLLFFFPDLKEWKLFSLTLLNIGTAMLAQSIKVCCIKSINVNETDILTIRQNNSEPSEMFVLGSESGFLERSWIVSDIPKKSQIFRILRKFNE